MHTAAVPGVWGPWKLYHGINTQGTLNVINACKRMSTIQEDDPELRATITQLRAQLIGAPPR